jgi:hypothetical protein
MPGGSYVRESGSAARRRIVLSGFHVDLARLIASEGHLEAAAQELSGVDFGIELAGAGASLPGGVFEPAAGGHGITWQALVDETAHRLTALSDAMTKTADAYAAVDGDAAGYLG